MKLPRGIGLTILLWNANSTRYDKLLCLSSPGAGPATAWGISQWCVKWSISHSTNVFPFKACVSSHGKWQSCWANPRQFRVTCINSGPYLSDISPFNIPSQMHNTCLDTYFIKICSAYVGCPNSSRNFQWIFINYFTFTCPGQSLLLFNDFLLNRNLILLEKWVMGKTITAVCIMN